MSDNKNVRKIGVFSILLSFFAAQAVGELCSLDCTHHSDTVKVSQNDTPPCHSEPTETDSSEDCCSPDACKMELLKADELEFVNIITPETSVDLISQVSLSFAHSRTLRATGPPGQQLRTSKIPLYLTLSQIKIPFLSLA